MTERGRFDLFTVAGIIIGIGAAVIPLDWIFRTLLVALAIGLTIYAAMRHPAHPTLRWLIAICIAFAFMWATSKPIWNDFHKEHPNIAVQWPITFGASSGRSSSQQTDKVTARLRLRYIKNSATAEIIQNTNVAKYHTLAMVNGGGGAATEPFDSKRIQWTILFIVFDRPVTAPHMRVQFEGGNSPVFDIRTFTPRSAIIIFDGPLGDKIVDIEAYY